MQMWFQDSLDFKHSEPLPNIGPALQFKKAIPIMPHVTMCSPRAHMPDDEWVPPTAPGQPPPHHLTIGCKCPVLEEGWVHIMDYFSKVSGFQSL